MIQTSCLLHVDYWPVAALYRNIHVVVGRLVNLVPRFWIPCSFRSCIIYHQAPPAAPQRGVCDASHLIGKLLSAPVFFDHTSCKTPFWNRDLPMDKFAENSKQSWEWWRKTQCIAMIAAVFAVTALVVMAWIRRSAFKKGQRVHPQNLSCKHKHTACFIDVA